MVFSPPKRSVARILITRFPFFLFAEMSRNFSPAWSATGVAHFPVDQPTERRDQVYQLKCDRFVQRPHVTRRPRAGRSPVALRDCCHYTDWCASPSKILTRLTNFVVLWRSWHRWVSIAKNLLGLWDRLEDDCFFLLEGYTYYCHLLQNRSKKECCRINWISSCGFRARCFSPALASRVTCLLNCWPVLNWLLSQIISRRCISFSGNYSVIYSLFAPLPWL